MAAMVAMLRESSISSRSNRADKAAPIAPPKLSAAAVAAHRGHRGGKVAPLLRGKVAAMEAAALAATPGYARRCQRDGRDGPTATAYNLYSYPACLHGAEEVIRNGAAVTVQAMYRGFRSRRLAATSAA